MRPRAAGVERRIDRHRHQDPAERRQHRDHHASALPQLAEIELALGLQAHDQEEDGHQPLVDPDAKVRRDPGAADAHRQRRRPHRLVGVPPRRVRPHQRRHRRERHHGGATGLRTQKVANRRPEIPRPRRPPPIRPRLGRPAHRHAITRHHRRHHRAPAPPSRRRHTRIESPAPIAHGCRRPRSRAWAKGGAGPEHAKPWRRTRTSGRKLWRGRRSARPASSASRVHRKPAGSTSSQCRAGRCYARLARTNVRTPDGCQASTLAGFARATRELGRFRSRASRDHLPRSSAICRLLVTRLVASVARWRGLRDDCFRLGVSNCRRLGRRSSNDRANSSRSSRPRRRATHREAHDGGGGDRD